MAVFVQRRLEVSRDAIAIALLQERRHDREALGEFRRRRPVAAVDGRRELHQAVLRLRQGDEHRVHRVVAIEVGVENQVRGVTDVAEHRPQIGQQVQRPFSGDRRIGGLLHLRPLGHHGIRADVIALTGGQPLGRELQGLARGLLDGHQRSKGAVDPRGFAVDVAAGPSL